MKKILTLVLALAMALSCIGFTAVAEGEIAEKVVVGLNNDPQNLGPFQGMSAGRIGVLYTMYEMLAVTEGGETYGVLMQDCEKVDDLTYNITIYDYIYDQAGNHLTADDIVWCYETAIASGNLPKLSSSIESVIRIDEYTAQFKFTALAIGDLGALLMECPIVTRAAYEASPDQMATDPVSTTAYAITEHVSGSKIVFENTGNYWQTDASKIRKTSAANVQTIEFDIIPDGSQLTNALKTRAIDVTVWLSDTDIVDFQDAEGYSLASIPDNTTYGMIFNDSANGNSIFKDNLEARQAVAYAIDNNMLVQGALDGNGNPAYTIGNENYSDFLAKWKEEDYYNYDPTKAAELAQSSGLAGQTVTVMYVSTDINSKLFSIIQALLGQIGVNVEGLGIDTQLYNQYKYEDDKWDICLIQDGSTSYLVNVWKMEWDRTGYTHGGAVNFVVDDELQQLLETAMDADLHNDETMDAFHRYLTDNCYGIGLVQQMSNVAHTDTIKVLATDARGQVIPGGCEY